MSSRTLTALVGAPNSGKTTLYNWLTGSHFRTVNYPGSTIEYAQGVSHERYGRSLDVLDTPGVYSLFPKSPDEDVTHKVLFSPAAGDEVQAVICVVDATQLARHLYVVKQVQEAGFRFVVAVTMMDLLEKSRQSLDLAALSHALGAPVVAIHGLLGGGVRELVAVTRKVLGEPAGASHPLHEWETAKRERVRHELDALVRSLSKRSQPVKAVANTRHADRWLLHPAWGLLLFLTIMTGLFSSIYWLAQPFMDLVDSGFTWAAHTIVSLAGIHLWSDFLADGVVTSLGSVLVFVPQIFILFLGIGFLEDSGYLARAATLIDRPLARLGMTGRSFVPILSAHACAVPALMATRQISSWRDRLITMLVLPLMTCSARLPVYALLLTFLFHDEPAWKPGLALALIYFAAILVGGFAAVVLNGLMPKSTRSFFMLELPLYRLPKFRIVLKNAMTRTRGYVRKAGPVIFVIAVILWVLKTFPNYEMPNVSQRFETSYLSQIGQTVEPIFKPMGVDWRVGVGLLSAFAAREVFVSTLTLIFNVDETSADDDAIRASLIEQMANARWPSGEPIFTLASVLGLIVFFMIALQCMSTVSVAWREMGSWKLALGQLLVMNVAGYIAAVVVVRIVGA